jgi:hypothetical protein
VPSRSHWLRCADNPGDSGLQLLQPLPYLPAVLFCLLLLLLIVVAVIVVVFDCVLALVLDVVVTILLIDDIVIVIALLDQDTWTLSSCCSIHICSVLFLVAFT